MRVEVEHATLGTLPLVGSPLRLSQTPVEYGLAPPLLGQHTDEVLTGLLALEQTEIDRLRRMHVL